MDENRSFPPTKEFSEKAHIKSMEAYKSMYQQSIQDPEKFWSEVANDLHWFKKWDTVLEDSKKPFFSWYKGAKTNLCYNCVDRHLEGPNKNKAAVIWEGEPGEEKVLTYQDLHREICKFANGLKSLGVKKGDRVALYLPMVPELIISVLACARIGAVHSVIFAGAAEIARL